jgi:methionine-rich copper-binding protein CopC
MSRRWSRLAPALLAAALILFDAPASALAHAGLVLASPEPGTGLAQAPAAVIVKFSEPLNLSLTLRTQEALKSALLVERLRASEQGSVYVSTYRFQAPDRTEIAPN